MADRIVLISDDSDFFDYIKNKLELRKSDELYTFSFDSVPSQLHILKNSVFIINSENSNNKTLDLLKLLENSPAIVIAYNSDEVFLKKCYRAGAIDFITLLTSDSEFRARLLPALNLTGILEKNKFYRELLTKNSIIDKNNEVYTNYEEIIEKEIEEIKIYQKKAIFFAISPSDSTKLSISPNSIETALLNNIRKNDILMNYAPNKYFLILFDLDINSAEKLWTKISQKLNNKLYAGITVITNQKKEQLINEVLNKLHRSINYEKNIVESEHKLNNLGYVNNSKIEAIQNFKIFKKNFEKQFEQIIIPAFYQAQQNYQNKLTGVLIEQEFSDLKGTFIIKNSSITREFIVTCPGYSKVNIDILYRKDSQIIDSKRITLEPEELEGALFQDLLEQFIIEYKKEASYDF